MLTLIIETEFTQVYNMVYQIYLLTIVGDYEFDEFVRITPWLVCYFY